MAGQVGLLEQQEHDWGHGVHYHEEAHAAVGQHGDDEDGDQHDVLAAEPVDELVANGCGAARLVHQLGV